MFNWFRPHFPVNDSVRSWVDWRTDWLIRQFGRERLTDYETILPLADHFPADYNASHEAVRALFDQVCEYMDIDRARLELACYCEGKGRNYGLGPRFNRGTAGLYDEREDRPVIWLETSNVNDPMSVVATFAHELCHYQLLGSKRVGRDEPDHEPLTDLAVIFFGFGIFAANASFRSSSYSSGNWHYTSMKRQGYLPPPVLGYGLALYALLRQETNPNWDRYVRPDVREPMRKALALQTRGSAYLELGRCGEAVDDLATSLAIDRDAKRLGRIAETAYLLGKARARQGEHHQAIHYFSLAIHELPTWATPYESRAEVYERLGEAEKAAADRDEAAHRRNVL